VYQFGAWQRTRDDGTIEQGTRVTSRHNPWPSEPVFESGPPNVDAKLLELAAQVDDASELIAVLIELRNFPEFDLPLLPSSDFLGVDDYDLAIENRANAELERADLLHSMSTGVRKQIELAGGAVRHEYWRVGWLSARIPATALSALSLRNDLAAIISPDHETDTGLMSQDDIRPNGWAGSQGLWDDGHKGGEPNSARHGAGNIMIAVAEPWALEDEACAFYATPNCTGTSRIWARYRCDDQDNDGNFCEYVASFSEAEEAMGEGSEHGTTVASAALADYMRGQADNHALGDPTYPLFGAHFGSWERGATGSAPEASLVYFGINRPGATDESYADALADAAAVGADIVTNGWGWLGYPCNLDDHNLTGAQAEAAFDDGIFLSIYASNVAGPSQSSCNVGHPAQVPKVMAINGLDMNQPGCDTDYLDCKLSTSMSARGGAQVTVGGVTYYDRASVIDLVVPHNLTHVTNDQGTRGTVVHDSTTGGTSIAAPRLAGLAAVAKGWFLDDGLGWINNPGWLHVYMLGQGDRHRSMVPSDKSFPTLQLTTGTDKFYGMGRVKMRYPGQTGALGLYDYHFQMLGFTYGVTKQTFLAFGGKMPTGTDFLKCTMFQDEDMSSKSWVSHFDLEIQLREPSCIGLYCYCSTGGTPTTSARSDTSYDIKKMVSYEANQPVPLQGKCAYVTLERDLLWPWDISTQTFCYVADVADDEPSQ